LRIWVQAIGSRVLDPAFRFWSSSSDSGVQGSAFRVKDSPGGQQLILEHLLFSHLLYIAGLRVFRVQGSGFRIQGSGFRVQGSGFRVQGLGFGV